MVIAKTAMDFPQFRHLLLVTPPPLSRGGGAARVPGGGVVDADEKIDGPPAADVRFRPVQARLVEDGAAIRPGGGERGEGGQEVVEEGEVEEEGVSGGGVEEAEGEGGGVVVEAGEEEVERASSASPPAG